jgi:ribosomal RNA-processing protein 17
MDEEENSVNRPSKKRKKTKNRQTKVEIKFDEDQRTEFLTGFRKRKNQRKEKAKQDNERLLKEARARIKRKAKEEKKKKLEEIMESFEKISKENKDGLSQFETEKQVFEDDSTTVTVAAIELTT